MHKGDYLFDIQGADDLYCVFDGVGNEIALVKVFDEGGKHRCSITFTVPAYVKCPLKWKGARFRLADSYEKQALLSSVPAEVKDTWTSAGMDVAEKFYEYQSLFIVDVDADSENPTQVRILAYRAKLHSKK